MRRAMLALTLLVFALPLVSQDALVKDVVAKRGTDAGVIIIGKTSLPKNCKLMVDFLSGGRLSGQSDARVSDRGEFASAAFSNKGKPWPAGTYRVKVTSYFNGFWQSPDVMAKVGEGGKLLSGSGLVADDPEFPKANRHLDISFQIAVPGLSSEQQAIEAVKNARLTVTGQGLSADPVKTVVAYFEKAGGFKALAWTAKQNPDQIWVVTLECWDARVRKQAQWEFNSKTKAVKYLDPLSKTLSWLPRD